MVHRILVTLCSPYYFSILKLDSLNLRCRCGLILLTFFYLVTPTHIWASSKPVPVDPQQHSSTGIIGGEVAESEQWLWMAALIRSENPDTYWGQFCGGSLIHPEWVLTAAHCTYLGTTPFESEDIEIVLGAHQLDNENLQRIPVTQIIRHPRYTPPSFDADLALLHLATPSTQPIVQLASPATSFLEEMGVSATVLGWGRTEGRIRSDTLMQVSLPLVTNATCQTAYDVYGHNITSNMICAGYEEGGRDACKGDSGGPLVVQDEASEEWFEIGIVSWGKGCAQPDLYGVYTRISQFKEWVDLQILLHQDDSTAQDSLTGQASNNSIFYFPLIRNQ